MKTFLALLTLSLLSCSRSFIPQDYPIYNYDKNLSQDIVLSYDGVQISGQDMYNKNPASAELGKQIQFIQKINAFLDSKDSKTLVLNPEDKAHFFSMLARLDIDYKTIDHEFSKNSKSLYPNNKNYKPLNLNNTKNVDLARIYTDYYFNLLTSAHNFIGRNILWKLAKEQNLKPNEYLDKYINNIDLSVNDQELKRYLYMNNLDRESLSKKNIEQLKSSLEQEKKNKRFSYFISKYAFKTPLKTSVERPHLRFEKEPQEPFILGNGVNTIAVYSSFNCQPCLRWHEQLLEFYDGNKRNIKIYYYPSFSKNDSTSKLFFETSLCMSEQKKDVFWDLLKDFTKIKDIAIIEKELVAYAEKINLDVAKVKSCIVSRKYQKTIEYYQNFSNYLQIKTYPLAIVDGYVFGGVINLDRLEHAILLSSHNRKDSFFSRIIQWFKNLF